MSHASVISNLKLLIKQPITANDPGDHIEHLINESDRSSIILHAALLEEMLVAQLEKLMPTINGDERDRLFDFEGRHFAIPVRKCLR